MPGEATISIYTFSGEHPVLRLLRTPIQNARVPEYTPRGNTALYDAIGEVTTTLGEHYRDLPEEERPEHVILVIMTDGEENSSKEYRQEQIQKMLKHQQEVYSWKVLFLGANIDAKAAAARMGIKRSTAVNYRATSLGVGAAYTATSDAVKHMRSNIQGQREVAEAVLADLDKDTKSLEKKA